MSAPGICPRLDGGDGPAGRGSCAACAAVGVGQDGRSSSSRAGWPSLGVELLSTGGTATALRESGLEVRSVEDFTGFPEIMGGRVKTLHPKIYAGVLALRDNEEHMAAAAEHEVEFVDLVCVNLYPFEATAARRGVTEHEVIENIDIGGPTMIRAAAKNFALQRGRRQPGELRRRARGAQATPAASCRWARASRWPPRRSPTPPATTARSRAGSSRSRTTSRRCC